MVGGIVIETIDCLDKVWVNTREQRGTQECAIYVARTVESLSISEGDVVWWQGNHAMWTPRSLSNKGKPLLFVDKKLKRIGSSGVPRPITWNGM